MAARSGGSPGCCTLKKTLNKLTSGTSASTRTRTHSEPLYVISLERYGRDPEFEIRFPDVISRSDSLYDATITDGDCKIRVSLDPGVNKLISRNKLHCGSVIRHVEFRRGEDSGESGDALHVCSLEVDGVSGGDAALRALSSVNVRSIPWMGEEPKEGPIRAWRSSYLPLWNNQDHYGELWRDTPPSDPGAESDSEDERQDTRSMVSLSVIRRRFLSGSRRFPGVLCVRILHKSRLMYYGKIDQKCECPYKDTKEDIWKNVGKHWFCFHAIKAELQVGDGTSSACVVLWNTLCLNWYRILQPGQVVKLSHYRVKESYCCRSGEQSEPQIEISLNSRNPTAHISIIPKNQISPDWLLPDLPQTFISRQELPFCPQGHICDVIGVVIFIGRSERVRGHDGQRSELEEYRWLQLEDGTSDRPIIIKLFSTSQPDIQRRIYPMSLLVCTQLKLIKSTIDRATTFEYLTNTSLTQVYCTGTGSHPVMPYKGLRPIRQFLQWLKQANESSMLERAMIGGYFSYPPLPISLHTFMEKRHGEAGLISGGEMKLECEKMNYRERRRFTIQCIITAACYHHREDSGRTQYTDLPSAPLSPRVPRQKEGSEPHRTTVKRKLFSTTAHRKRLAPPLQPSVVDDDTDRDFSLFDGAMEFLVGECDDDSNDEDDDEDFSTQPISPSTLRLGLTRVAIETLPRVFCYERRHIQAAAVGMQANSFHKLLPQRELESFSPASCYKGYFTLTMKALSDGVTLDVIFLPAVPGNLHWTSLPFSHDNSWESVLSHGGFSPHAPPPSPADLITKADQLTNQRLMCVLEACALGAEKIELVLNRAFPLRS